jgi:hypothetical protein
MDLQPMYRAKLNSPETNIASSIAATTTQFSVVDVSAVTPDDGVFPILLMIGGNRTDSETVLLTAINGNTLTVQRGYKSTARAWEGGENGTGELIAANFGAQHHNSFIDNIYALNNDIVDIKNVIPTQTNPSNQLADKDFVNSSISNMAARYMTPDAAGLEQWESIDALRTGGGAGLWYNGGQPANPGQNDYAIFINTDNSIWRASFNGNLWTPTYKINDTPFTAAQLAALNSNITNELVQKINDIPSVQTFTSLLTLNWIGTEAPFTQTVYITGITAEMTPIVDVALSVDLIMAQAELSSWGLISRIVTNDGEITVTCFDAMPTTEIPIRLLAIS